jgi:hypothetical protein
MKIFVCPYRKSGGREIEIMCNSLEKHMTEDYFIYIVGDNPMIEANNIQWIDFKPKGKTKEQRVARKLNYVIETKVLKSFVLINDDIFLTRPLTGIHELWPLYYSGKISEMLDRYPINNLYRLTLKNSMFDNESLNFAVHFPMIVEDSLMFLKSIEALVTGNADRYSFRNVYGNMYYLENGFETILQKITDCKLFSKGESKMLDDMMVRFPWVSVGDGWFTKENREYLIKRII